MKKILIKIRGVNDTIEIKCTCWDVDDKNGLKCYDEQGELSHFFSDVSAVTVIK